MRLRPLFFFVSILLLLTPMAWSQSSAREQVVTKTGLTDAASNSVFEVDLPADARTSGAVEWKITATDGADHQERYGDLQYTAVNDAGAVTCNLTWSSTSVTVTAGTLTMTACTCTAGASKITIAIEPNSSLVPTTLAVDLKVTQRSPQSVTRL